MILLNLTFSHAIICLFDVINLQRKKEDPCNIYIWKERFCWEI